MDNKISATLDTLNIYFEKYLNLDAIRYEEIISDLSVLDKIIDTLIELIFKIGIDENLQPTTDGIILDGCLENLNELRQKRK